MALQPQGLWELSINKPHHAELELRHLRPLVQRVQCHNVEVSRVCAAAVWGLAVNERSRALLLELGAVQVLLLVARRSLVMQCMGDSEALPGDYVAAGRCSQTQRDQLQACVLGALSVMIIDRWVDGPGLAVRSGAGALAECMSVPPQTGAHRACRQPLIEAEPSCGTLFEMCSNLPGYEDRAWAAARREAAAKALTSLVQRDHDSRMQLVLMGGLTNILGLLDSKVCTLLHECAASRGGVHGAVADIFRLLRATRAPGPAACSSAWRRCWPRWCWMMMQWS
jgi:hypothetical protein